MAERGLQHQSRVAEDPNDGTVELLGAMEVVLDEAAVTAALAAELGYPGRLPGVRGPIPIEGNANPHISDLVASVAETGNLIKFVRAASQRQKVANGINNTLRSMLVPGTSATVAPQRSGPGRRS